MSIVRDGKRQRTDNDRKSDKLYNAKRNEKRVSIVFNLENREDVELYKRINETIANKGISFNTYMKQLAYNDLNT